MIFTNSMHSWHLVPSLFQEDLGWIPLNHSIAVNKLLGFDNRVAMTNRKDHSQDADSNEKLCLFFEHFLKYDGLSHHK